MTTPSKNFTPTSTVGRKNHLAPADISLPARWSDNLLNVRLGDSSDFYAAWDAPTTIVSDGAYGVLGFEGDTSDHLGVAEWYEPHIAAWSKAATAQTTLWFWNSEIGWAVSHPILERYGWRYVNTNIWDKGMGHVAGNVNTTKIRRFPVVSEVCVQYVFEARIDGQLLKNWLLKEWKRTGLPLRRANEACGVADAAVRKYLDQGHLWYFPPADKFEALQVFANSHGKPDGRPYFSIDGTTPLSGEDWLKFRAKFFCPHGTTNVWQRGPLHSRERLRAANGKAAHFNQKPLDLMRRIIEASSEPGDVVWEPFGGLFSALVAARELGRKGFGAEINPSYFQCGLARLRQDYDDSLFPEGVYL